MTPPDIPQPPRPGVVHRLAGGVLAMLGWRVEVAWPPVPRGVIVVYPHTSNWDFVYGYLARLAVGLPLQWVGKRELFRWPLGPLFRRMGGIAVDRSERTGMVAQLARELLQRPWFWIVVAPEGTRAHTTRWKSGFYHLARAADVPVGLGWIDYASRVVGLSTWVTMTGDVEADLARIRAGYAGKIGRHPERAGEIRFEDPPPPTP